MISLKEFKENNIVVNWGTLLLGWVGFKFFDRQLSFDEIDNFCEGWLKKTDYYNDLVVSLMTAEKNDSISIKDILENLVSKYEIDLNIELKKWRFILLKKLISKIEKENNYEQGLIDLTDFWAMFDFPEDSPHVVQGVDNRISPIEYYSRNNFEKELKAHSIWLAKELNELQKSSNENDIFLKIAGYLSN